MAVIDPSSAAMSPDEFKSNTQKRLMAIHSARVDFVEWVTGTFPEDTAELILVKSDQASRTSQDCIHFLLSRIAFEWEEHHEALALASGKIVQM